MAYGAILGQTSSGFAPLEGLPTNDVRNLTIASGYSVNAGDVVDLDENNNVYINVTPQANVENVITSTAVTATDTCYLNEQYSVTVLATSSNVIAYLIDNATGKSVSNKTLDSSEYTHISTVRFDDSHFIVYGINSVNDALYRNYCTVSGSAITAGSFSNQGENDITSQTACKISDSYHVSIYSNGSTLSLRLRQNNSNTVLITTQSINYGANYISACKLPDDSNGNKRVCICFADTSDGNKGKAVIATIDSSNAVTFGDVATIYSSIFRTHNSLTMWDDSTAVVVNYTASNVVAKAFTIQDNIISQIGNEVTLTSLTTAGSYFPIIKVGNALVVIESIDGSSRCQLLRVSNNVIEVVQGFFSFNNSKFDYCSASNLDSNHFIVAYADGGNSNYGTTTILEVSGNQIAGSFINNSKDAIALESGESGEIIKLGFGGYCQCDGVTSGQSIDSNGVTAYSPIDGWLNIKDVWSKGYVTGEYTGDGTFGSDNPTVIDVGFKPSVIIIISSHVRNNAAPSSAVFANGMTGYKFNSNDSNGSVITWNSTGISIYTNSTNAAFQYNSVDYKYYYIAWR